MFDDDYPDYYLGDDEDRQRRSRRIDFAPQHPDGKPEGGDDDDDEDELHDVTERDDYRGPRPGHRRGINFTGLLAALVLVAAALTVYFRYLTPYVQESVVTGAVLDVDREGLIFKTYEARVMMPDGAVQELSVASERVARQMQALQGTDTRVNLECERYYGAAPWRGKSTTVVTGMRPVSDSDEAR